LPEAFVIQYFKINKPSLAGISGWLTKNVQKIILKENQYYLKTLGTCKKKRMDAPFFLYWGQITPQ
jgi:hypothetical protein